MNYELIDAYWGLNQCFQIGWRIRNKFAISNYTEFDIDKILLYPNRSDGQFYTISIILQE